MPHLPKSRLPFTTVPSAIITETIIHHKRTIGMDHVTVTPPDEDGYIGLLLIVENIQQRIQYVTTQPPQSQQFCSSITVPILSAHIHGH
jgi:hypothetical protein